MNEKMAGGYMERNRAFQAAEQALRQGEDLLFQNASTCYDGCSITSGAITSSATRFPMPTTALASCPPVNTDPNIRAITMAPGGVNPNACYEIVQLDNAIATGEGKTDCRAYSIMARGQGFATGTAVTLQTVTYVCEV